MRALRTQQIAREDNVFTGNLSCCLTMAAAYGLLNEFYIIPLIRRTGWNRRVLACIEIAVHYTQRAGFSGSIAGDMRL